MKESRNRKPTIKIKGNQGKASPHARLTHQSSNFFHQQRDLPRYVGDYFTRRIKRFARRLAGFVVFCLALLVLALVVGGFNYLAEIYPDDCIQ